MSLHKTSLSFHPFADLPRVCCRLYRMFLNYLRKNFRLGLDCSFRSALIRVHTFCPCAIIIFGFEMKFLQTAKADDISINTFAASPHVFSVCFATFWTAYAKRNSLIRVHTFCHITIYFYGFEIKLQRTTKADDIRFTPSLPYPKYYVVCFATVWSAHAKRRSLMRVYIFSLCYHYLWLWNIMRQTTEADYIRLTPSLPYPKYNVVWFASVWSAYANKRSSLTRVHTFSHYAVIIRGLEIKLRQTTEADDICF